MSQAQEAQTEDRPTETAEERAKRLGWKPQAEYSGDPARWRSAEEFIKRGEEDLPVLRERNRMLEKKFGDLERKQAESIDLLQEMTTRVRTADERALKKARTEIEAERIRAVELGDTVAFNKADKELTDLNHQEVVQRPVARPTAPAVSDEVVAWGNQNPWFHSDQTLRQAAIDIHGRLLQTNPELSTRDNLARVTSGLRAMYPDKFQDAPTRQTQQPVIDDDNPRRREASPVAGSTPAAPARQSANERSFDKLPKAEKDAYHKYAKQLEGKGKPLTKDEWVSYYYDDQAE